MTENWIDFGISVLGGATAFLCLYEGTRRLATYGVHRKGVLMTVMALAVCALYGAFAYWKYLDLKVSLGASQHKPASLQLPAGWGQGFSAEKRTSLSLARARRAYLESGMLGDYLAPGGETRSFAPAEEDLKRRERLVAHYARLELAARSSLAEALLWLIAAAVAVIFGFAVSLEKAPVTAEPPPDDEPPPR
ncbi:MAG: hypothetical protein WBO23_14430 [Burkholderiales bacterium]